MNPIKHVVIMDEMVDGFKNKKSRNLGQRPD